VIEAGPANRTTPVDAASLQAAMIVAGADLTADAWIDVRDPATDRVIGMVPDGGPTHARAGIDAAAAALDGWRGASPWERHAVVSRLADLVMRDQERLAHLLTAEQGKPVRESRAEIAGVARYLRDAAEDAVRVNGEILPRRIDGRRAWVLHEAVGVVAAITPWNFPAVIAARKVAPALAVGCTVILRPSSLTPLSSLALAALARDAGFPGGVLNVVTGDASAIADAFLDDRRVRHLSFTGSTSVGQRLQVRAATHVTRLTLELGGLAPFIVFDDADLDAAAEGFMASKFRNGGQTCICPNVLLVQEGVAGSFTALVTRRTAALRVGPGTAEDTDIGPLIDDRAVAKVERHVADAVGRGARLVQGGHRAARQAGFADRFYEPTVLVDVPPAAELLAEETFGPVVAVQTFRTEAEAIAMANATPYGLAAYFYTRSTRRLFDLPSKLDFGIIGANDGQPSRPGVPLGGTKGSGIGREGGPWGIAEYLETKYVSIVEGD
jgi:succinate-semialdehyde dehydrogenase/glutarate-semialdehyde dehydrogenase